MTEEQWREVEEQYDAMYELPPAERAALVAAIADPVVRSELTKLLDDTGDSAAILTSIIETAAVAVTTVERIGPYSVVRRLGNGGQGTVFEAVRDDGNFHQRVAIKIVKWEMDSDAARERFVMERQILAGLEHPNIARLLDGGQTANGAPYLVMEYVDGLPLTAATEGWPLRKKLELFLAVADAVAQAHRNLIVHRDLKPANIMVTKDGTPKLLDFGIAKLLVENAQRTMTGMIAFTPDYATPEQVRGEAITTACDVYSLGVNLYEMLTGQRPYNVPTLAPMDIHNAVCLTEPAPPGLGKDLDNILLMAMRKEPARRYASVEQFAEDVRRSMDHRPVLARGDSFSYRASRFVRRNALALGAAAAVMVAIAGGAAVALRQARISNERFEQVRRLAHSFVFDYTDDLAKLQGTTAVRAKMVGTAVEYLDNLSKSAEGDLGLQKELAAAYRKVGDAQGYPTRPSLGKTEEAIASYRKAAAIYERIAAKEPAQQNALGVFEVDFAHLLLRAGNLVEAERMAEAGLQHLSGANEREVADAWCVLGQVAVEPSHFTLALERFRKCDAITSELVAKTRNVQNLYVAALSRNEFGSSAAATGQLREALQAFDDAQALHEEVLRKEPFNPAALRGLALLGQDQSRAWFDDSAPHLNDPARSAVYARQYLDGVQRMVDRDAKDQSARFSLAIAKLRLSMPLKYLDPKAAVASARESVAIFDELIAAGRKSFLVLSRRNRALRRYAEALLFYGHAAEARAQADEALRGERVVLSKDPKNQDELASLALILLAAADAAVATHEPAAAETFLTEAQSVAAGIYAANPKELTSVIPLARIRERLGVHWRRSGDAAKAGRWFAAAAKLWTDHPEQNDYVRREEAALAARIAATPARN